MAQSSFNIKFKSSLKEDLRKFTDGVKEQALRPAAHAAALVLYHELKLRTPIGETGTLNAAVYRYHIDEKSGLDQQTYAVGVNMKKAPHWHLLEYGTVRMVAHPFLRPTYDAKAKEALAAARRRLAEKIKELK